MTRYTVVWDTEVEAAFANQWLAGDSAIRSILTAIADWTDTYLAEDAEIKGRSLPNRAARVIAVPFSITSARVEVHFEVHLDDRLVRINRFVFCSE